MGALHQFQAISPRKPKKAAMAKKVEQAIDLYYSVPYMCGAYTFALTEAFNEEEIQNYNPELLDLIAFSNSFFVP